MSNRSLIADHASKTYFVIGKWPIFGPGASHKFMVGKNPDGDGDVLELSDTIAVQKELAYWNCTDVRECTVALWEFANNKTVITPPRKGFVLSHEPKGQVHPAMTTVAYENDAFKDGYLIKTVNASLTRYTNRDIDQEA
jgi:hypothetical protein